MPTNAIEIWIQIKIPKTLIFCAKNLSGLDNIHRLVQNGYIILRVELEEGTDSAFAEYSSFYIAGEADKYRIHVSGYSGTAGKHVELIHQNNDIKIYFQYVNKLS